MGRSPLRPWPAIAAFAALCLAPTAIAADAHPLDDFADVSRWQVLTSDGVSLKCSSAESNPSDASHASALRLDFDFKSSGYAGIRRVLPLEMPENFELAFSIRGDLPPNNLELKLVDASGENVWWVNRRAFEFPHEWTRMASRRRHFQFAWGPSNQPLRKASAIEIVVSSAEGGRGTTWLDDLTFRPLPESKPYAGSPTVTATSIARDSAAQFAVDDKPDTMWRSEPEIDRAEVTVDFGQLREFGGMVIHWDPDQGSPSYDIQFSDDGTNWTTVRSSATYDRDEQYLAFPDSEARAVRLLIHSVPASRQFGIREIEFLPLEASRDPNAFALEVARRASRGTYPRAIGGEGTFWTIVGVPEDDHEALVSEDGAVEVDKQAFSDRAIPQGWR